MFYQNDTQRHNIIKETTNTLSDIKSLNYKSFFDFASKKTEKLVMALYMVTDSINMEKSLGEKIRSLSVTLMSDIHNFSRVDSIKKDLFIEEIQSKIMEIVSFLGVAQTIGFISEMNANILINEFDLLNSEVIKLKKENKIEDSRFEGEGMGNMGGFTFDEKYFAISLPEYKSLNQIPQETSYKGHIKDVNNNVLYKKERDNFSFKKDTTKQISREERRNQIIAFLKDKGFVSIKDISEYIKDCSSKTIQRELNDLVTKGQVFKEGEKRWSRYKIVN